MKEQYTGMKGYFKIESFNSAGKLLDSFEEKNLIVDVARQNMAKLMGGFTSGSSINRFVLGTDGYVNDVRTPKTIVNGLNKDLTELFSETNYEYFYEINFEGTSSSNGTREVISETDRNVGFTESTVSVVQLDRKITYVITIPQTVANNALPLTSADYTEAGFYCGDTLFNIKTFPVKVKDDDTILTITWTLEF